VGTHSVGLGWIKDLLDKRDFTAAALNLPTTPPPTSDDRKWIAAILDQDGLGSCVAQATCQAIRARQWFQTGGATAPELTSRFYVWWHCRNQTGDAARNAGTYIRTAFKLMNGTPGRPPERLWPQVLTDIDLPRPTYARKPPPSVLAAGFDKRKAEYNRVTEIGAARIPVIKQLIADHRFPVFGTMVDIPFTYADGPDYHIMPPTGIVFAGGHAMLGAAYDAEGVWVPNSWGKGWRRGGWAHLAWEYFAWDQTDDIWGVKLIG